MKPTLLVGNTATVTIDVTHDMRPAFDGVVVQTGDEIVGLLEQLNQAGQTIVMVTHNMAIAGRAKRILHMRDGRLSDSAPSD